MITAVHTAEIVGAISLLMVLRDMGNGVSRVEAARVLDGLGSVPFGFHPDATPVLFPLSAAVQDCVDVSLGLNGAESPPLFQDGLARYVCDAITEVWLW